MLTRMCEYQTGVAYNMGHTWKPEEGLLKAAHMGKLHHAQMANWLESQHMEHVWMVTQGVLVLLISKESDARLFEITWA